MLTGLAASPELGSLTPNETGILRAFGKYNGHGAHILAALALPHRLLSFDVHVKCPLFVILRVKHLPPARCLLLYIIAAVLVSLRSRLGISCPVLSAMVSLS